MYLIKKENINEKEEKQKYYNLFNSIINQLKYEIEGNKNLQERIPKKNSLINNYNIIQENDNKKNENIIEKLTNDYITKNDPDKNYFIQNNPLQNEIELEFF